MIILSPSSVQDHQNTFPSRFGMMQNSDAPKSKEATNSLIDEVKTRLKTEEKGEAKQPSGANRVTFGGEA